MLRYLFATMSMFVACNSTQIIESPQDECVVDTTLVSVKSTNIKKQDYIEKKWKSSTTSVPYDRVLSFSMDDGLPHSDVNDIIQDIYGYLWFATYGGLSKWDGYRIKTFRADNSLLTNDRVLCLLPAQDSLLYIGTEAGGLCFYDYKREQIMSIADDYSPAYGTDRVINYLFEDFEGTVWVCRNDGLGYLQKQSKHRSITSCFRWRDWNVQCGVSLDSTRLLLSTDAGLTIYNTHTEEREDVLRTSINSRCHAIRKLKDGRFALLGGWGVYIWDLKRNNLELICRYTARSVFEDHNQNIWIGSYESGVLKYNLSSQLVAHYHPELPTPHAIGSYEISSLFEDNSGVMWIGTIGAGLNRINIVDKNIKCYTKAQGIADNRVLTFMESTDGTLWISTRGGVDLFDRQTEEFTHLWINAKQSRDFNVVSAFFTDSKGNIWIGTWGSGLWVIDSNDVGVAISTGYAKARQVRHPAYGESLSVSKIIEDRDNHLWISTNSGLFVYSQDSIHPTNQWSHYSYDTEDNNSLSSNFITDIFADPDTEYKTIWVGARQGLHKIVFDKDGTSVCQRIDLVQAQGMNEPKVSFFVSEIHCDNNGCLWVATIGDGLQRMIEGRFTNTHPRFERFDTFNTEFYDNGLESLQEDNNGLFWIGGYGISRFNPATKDVKHYTVKDQLQSNAFKIWASLDNPEHTHPLSGI